MITSKKDLRYYIQEDKLQNLGAHKIGLFKFIIEMLYGTDRMKAFRLLKALRKLEYAKNVLRKRGILGKLVYAFRLWRYHLIETRYNVVIGTNMVGYGFRLPHITGGGIIINCKSMGCYCGANIGVVVGNNHTFDERPTIGDYVGLTMGCKVYGDIHIGNHVTVAPNSVVIHDVPDNVVVSGIPAEIIKHKSTF